MEDTPLRTSVIGSYPFPGWLEFASQNLTQFGENDIKEMQDDAVIAAILHFDHGSAYAHGTPRQTLGSTNLF